MSINSMFWDVAGLVDVLVVFEFVTELSPDTVRLLAIEVSFTAAGSTMASVSMVGLRANWPDCVR